MDFACSKAKGFFLHLASILFAPTFFSIFYAPKNIWLTPKFIAVTLLKVLPYADHHLNDIHFKFLFFCLSLSRNRLPFFSIHCYLIRRLPRFHTKTTNYNFIVHHMQIRTGTRVILHQQSVHLCSAQRKTL